MLSCIPSENSFQFHCFQKFDLRFVFGGYRSVCYDIIDYGFAYFWDYDLFSIKRE